MFVMMTILDNHILKSNKSFLILPYVRLDELNWPYFLDFTHFGLDLPSPLFTLGCLPSFDELFNSSPPD